ncbi:hypothetical protein BDP27DRAFT_1374025 [Rhodocollybia butyracea]|uniref:Uncharacterized protein n=1 Tax=Rhodocollybia butyracea TaxID=206335 RepID=A0A9P5TWT4_9AGAR|nr:hypothetical protein BDP27DRAFT_1374025 [Rhodocollybia butyracea]
MPPPKKLKTRVFFNVSDVVIISNCYPAQVISEETFRAAAPEDDKSSIQSLKTHLDKGPPEGSNSAAAKKRKIYLAYKDAYNVLSATAPTSVTCSLLCHEGDKPNVEHGAELEPIPENKAKDARKDNLTKLHAIHYRQEEEVFDTRALDEGEGQCEIAADSLVPDGSHQDEKEIGGHESDGDGRCVVEVNRDPPEKEKEAVNAWNLGGKGSRDLHRQDEEGKVVGAQDTDGEGETEVESDAPISEDDREDEDDMSALITVVVSNRGGGTGGCGVGFGTKSSTIARHEEAIYYMHNIAARWAKIGEVGEYLGDDGDICAGATDVIINAYSRRRKTESLTDLLVDTAVRWAERGRLWAMARGSRQERWGLVGEKADDVGLKAENVGEYIGKVPLHPASK